VRSIAAVTKDRGGEIPKQIRLRLPARRGLKPIRCRVRKPPFFDNHHVDHVTHSLVQKFAAWRIEKLGGAPRASTINTHNRALNRIFDEALMHGYISKTQLPVLQNKGHDGERIDKTISWLDAMTRSTKDDRITQTAAQRIF